MSLQQYNFKRRFTEHLSHPRPSSPFQSPDGQHNIVGVTKCGLYFSLAMGRPSPESHHSARDHHDLYWESWLSQFSFSDHQLFWLQLQCYFGRSLCNCKEDIHAQELDGWLNQFCVCLAWAILFCRSSPRKPFNHAKGFFRHCHDSVVAVPSCTTSSVGRIQSESIYPPSCSVRSYLEHKS